MEKLFETAVQGIVVSRRDGRIEQVNAHAEALFGYRRDELIGQSIELVLPADGAPGGAGIHRPADPGGARVQRVGRRKDGTRFPVELSQSPIRIGGTARVMSVVTDLSARARGEEAVARLATIVESSQDAIISETLDGVVLTWNAGSERIYGYSAEEVVGHSIARLIPPELPDELDSILEAIRREEDIAHYETVRVRKDGRRIHVSLDDLADQGRQRACGRRLDDRTRCHRAGDARARGAPGRRRSRRSGPSRPESLTRSTTPSGSCPRASS